MDIDMTPEQAECAKACANLPISPKNLDKRVARNALARDVLAVAHVFPAAGDFRVYIGAVPGKNHKEEIGPVLDHGTRMAESIARAIFPDFAALTYWRF